MKKLLAILLAFILTFSCVSLLSTGVALAETQEMGVNLIESDFHKSLTDANNQSMWQGINTVQYLDDNGDGTTDFARLTGAKTSKLYSYTAIVNPGNTYQISFDMRIPDSVTTDFTAFQIGNTTYKIFPEFALYQPSNTKAGERVKSEYSAGQNDYAYSYVDDAGNNKIRRTDFSAKWTIGNYTSTRGGYSDFGVWKNSSQYYKMCIDADGNVISPNGLLKEWTKVTMTFKAIEDANNQGPQVVAFCTKIGKDASDAVFDFKDFSLVCTDNGTVTKTIMQSDFNDADGTNWLATRTDAPLVTYGNDNGEGYARVKIHPTYKNQGLVSTPFELVPGNDYELTYYIRVPKETADGETESFKIGSTFYAPTVAFYQTTANSDGTKVERVPQVSNKEAENNYYAYNQKYIAATATEEAVLAWSRRAGFKATWTIEGYQPKPKENFSNFSYLDHGSVLSKTNADLNAAFADWTKVTVNFTAVANTEDETSQVTALGFTFDDHKSTDNFVFDIKDVKLTETAAIEEEKPEEIVIPELPGYPELPAEPTAPQATISTTVSGDENCHAFVTKELAAKGEKVSVSASPKIGYKFIGWYENDKLVTAEKHFTFNASQNRILVAKTELITEENKQISIAPDVNYDGVVGLEDITSLAQNFAGWDSVKLNTARADVNGDSNTNLYDLVLAAQYVADWDGIQDKLASKEAYVLPEEDLAAEGLAEKVRAGESEYFNKSTIINEGNRALLVQLFKKAEKGEPITVASIGGSITQGVNDAGKDRSYGKLVSEWFEEKFGIVVTNINAGIGSTGSLVGVHRLESDVLSHNPDLVILEYSVNDMSSRDKFAYLETYEAIIRRVLEKDIALMTAVFGGTGKQYYTDYLSLHIHSALHYDLPVIDYYSSLFRYLDSGVIKWYDEENKEEGGITKDNLHPNFAGHKMISSAMNNYLEDVYAKYQADEVYETAIDLPEETLFENAEVYETATFLASTNDLGYETITPYFNYENRFTAAKVHGDSSKMGKGWVCENQKGVIVFDLQDVTSISLSMMQKTKVTGTYSITINGKTIVNNQTSSTANNVIWPTYCRVFNEPTDLVVTITCHAGTVGVGPIGVTY